MANNSWQQRGSANPDPRTFQDPNVNPFARQVAPATNALVMQQQRQQIAGAARGISTEARQTVNKLVRALDGVAQTAQAIPTIRAFGKSGAASSQERAAQALQAQRDIVESGTAEAKAALAELKPALLSAVASLPAGVTDAQLANARADAIATLQAAGKSGANAAAQRMLRDAMSRQDAVMVWTLLGDPLRYQAPILGFSQLTLQQVYATAMLEQYGLHPLATSQQVPGGELISMLDFIKEVIDNHTAGATAALNQIAAEVGL